MNEQERERLKQVENDAKEGKIAWGERIVELEAQNQKLDANLAETTRFLKRVEAGNHELVARLAEKDKVISDWPDIMTRRLARIRELEDDAENHGFMRSQRDSCLKMVLRMKAERKMFVCPKCKTVIYPNQPPSGDEKDGSVGGIPAGGEKSRVTPMAAVLETPEGAIEWKTLRDDRGGMPTVDLAEAREKLAAADARAGANIIAKESWRKRVAELDKLLKDGTAYKAWKEIDADYHKLEEDAGIRIAELGVELLKATNSMNWYKGQDQKHRAEAVRLNLMMAKFCQTRCPSKAGPCADCDIGLHFGGQYPKPSGSEKGDTRERPHGPSGSETPREMSVSTGPSPTVALDKLEGEVIGYILWVNETAGGSFYDYRAYMERTLKAEHRGDCTHEPNTCERCYAEELVREAADTVERISEDRKVCQIEGKDDCDPDLCDNPGCAGPEGKDRNQEKTEMSPANGKREVPPICVVCGKRMRRAMMEELGMAVFISGEDHVAWLCPAGCVPSGSKFYNVVCTDCDWGAGGYGGNTIVSARNHERTTKHNVMLDRHAPPKAPAKPPRSCDFPGYFRVEGCSSECPSKGMFECPLAYEESGAQSDYKAPVRAKCRHEDETGHCNQMHPPGAERCLPEYRALCRVYSAKQ